MVDAGCPRVVATLGAKPYGDVVVRAFRLWRVLERVFEFDIMTMPAAPGGAAYERMATFRRHAVLAAARLEIRTIGASR